MAATPPPGHAAANLSPVERAAAGISPMGHFPLNARWVAPQNTEREAKREWPPGSWQREPGRDDALSS
jgi:hypothetical protein